MSDKEKLLELIEKMSDLEAEVLLATIEDMQEQPQYKLLIAAYKMHKEE